MTAGKKQDPPYKVRQKHLSHQALQVSEKSFKEGTTGEKVNNYQTDEDQAGNQKVQNDVEYPHDQRNKAERGPFQAYHRK